MKKLIVPILLAISLAVNVYLWRAHRRKTEKEGAAVSAAKPKTMPLSQEEAKKPAENAIAGTSDLKALVALLRTSNLPPALLRAWIKAEVDAHFAAREAALASPPAKHFWDPDPDVPLATKLARIDLESEKSRLLEDLLGYDPNLPENAGYSFLPLEKQREVKDVFELYSAKIDALLKATLVTPSLSMSTEGERAEIARWQKEMDEKLAPLITSSQLLQVRARTSIVQTPPPVLDANGNDISSSVTGTYTPLPLANKLREDLRYFDATEDEFVTIFGIQSDSQASHLHGRIDKGSQNQEINDQIRAVLGPDRTDAYVRYTEPAFVSTADFVVRSGLPVSAARAAVDLRDRVGAESAKIGQDPNLTADQKHAALAALAEQGRSEFENLLGPAASGASGLVNTTFQNIGRGMYQVTSPSGGKGFRPVAP